MQDVQVGGYRGFREFLSHKKFKTWAKSHGDVFKLKARVTLHQKATGDDMIRYCNTFLCLGLGLNILVQLQTQAEAGAAEVSEKRGLYVGCRQGHHAGRGHRGFHRQL